MHFTSLQNCPQLTLLADGTSKFYLTKGKQETIYVPAKRLPSQWKKFSCEITTRSGKKLATGQRSRTGIECQQVEVLIISKENLHAIRIKQFLINLAKT